MATFSQSTVAKGSDSVIDFCCSPCLEHKTDQWAEFYCENCLKLYCANCINLHGQLFGKHVTYGRRETKKWPVPKEVEDFLQKCDIHEGKRPELFCYDHSQLCCTDCSFLNHRQCVKVTLISESVNGPPPDLQRLSRKIQTILVELQRLQNNWDTNMQSLQVSYNEELHEIRQTRQKINTILDEIEKTTLKELDAKMTSLKAALNTDLENCNKLKHELKRLSNAIENIIDKGKAELIFIASKKCLEKIKQSETYLMENSAQVEEILAFQEDSDVQQYLSELSGLGRFVVCTQAIPLQGDPDQVLTVHGMSEYSVLSRGLVAGLMNFYSISVRTISGICVVSNDQIVVADNFFNDIKLLNHNYQTVGQYTLSAQPHDICQITPSEVAVAVNDDKTHEVQFVSIHGRQMVTGTQLKFKHLCFGIARYRKDLYITAGTALYKYSISGTRLNKLYEDTTAGATVSKCALSPSGDRIFVTKPKQNTVLTLARDGTVLHIFTHPDLQKPSGIHVTAQGQVLVCGSTSQNVLQLDGEGKKKLATLATLRNSNYCPQPVFYNKSTASMIVGLVGICINKILVFKVQ